MAKSIFPAALSHGSQDAVRSTPAAAKILMMALLALELFLPPSTVQQVTWATPFSTLLPGAMPAIATEPTCHLIGGQSTSLVCLS